MGTPCRHDEGAVKTPWCVRPTIETPWGHHGHTMVLRATHEDHHGHAMGIPWIYHGELNPSWKHRRHPMDAPWCSGATMERPWARHGHVVDAPRSF